MPNTGRQTFSFSLSPTVATPAPIRRLTIGARSKRSKRQSPSRRQLAPTKANSPFLRAEEPLQKTKTGSVFPNRNRFGIPEPKAAISRFGSPELQGRVGIPNHYLYLGRG